MKYIVESRTDRTFRKECGHCDCVFEYNSEDTYELVNTKYLSHGSYKRFVDCPECDKELIHR